MVEVAVKSATSAERLAISLAPVLKIRKAVVVEAVVAVVAQADMAEAEVTMAPKLAIRAAALATCRGTACKGASAIIVAKLATCLKIVQRPPPRKVEHAIPVVKKVISVAIAPVPRPRHENGILNLRRHQSLHVF